MKTLIGFCLLTFAFFHQAQALRNSVAAEGRRYESSVFIKPVIYYKEDNTFGDGYCNATVVSPRVLLTAAHCVTDAAIYKKPLVKIEFGEYVYPTRKDGTIYRLGYKTTRIEQKSARFVFLDSVQKKVDQKKSDNQVGVSEDLAIIYLDEALNLPQDFHFSKILSARSWETVKPSLNQGRLHPLVVTVNPVGAVSTLDFRQMGRLNKVKVNWQGYLESNSTVMIDFGDSGSGVFLEKGDDLYWFAAVKGEGQMLWMKWDAYTIGVGKICGMAQKAKLQSEDLKVLCP